MVIKTSKGMYQILKNYRDAFNEEAFVEKYIEECFDKYMYIVGDISSGILRLKGFDTNPKSKNYYGFIEDYLEISCAFGCPFYIMKRIASDKEFENLKNDKTEYNFETLKVESIKKENFDKESLILNSSGKGHPHIVIDMNKINAIPKGELAPDLVDVVKQDRVATFVKDKQIINRNEETTSTYVSASPDFDPSKSNSSKFNRNNKNNNNNNNKNYNNNRNKNNANKNKNRTK